MVVRHEEIELLEGESGYVYNGKLCISPTEIGIDMVLLRFGENEDSDKQTKVGLGQSVKVKAGRQFAVSLLGVGEGSLEENIPPSAKFSVTRL